MTTSAELLKVQSIDGFGGVFQIPPSKPETQRAILAASLGDKTSRIFNDLRCAETDTMKHACRTLGAEIIERTDHLEVHGIGPNPRCTNRTIQAAGSGLVFRTFAALSCGVGRPVIVTGDAVLCKRIMAPLFAALRELGADLESICSEGQAPIVNWGRRLRGGTCHLPGNLSSQFITAILFAAPFAERPVEIILSGDVLSKSYIQQTITQLRRSGIDVTVSDDFRHYRVLPGRYQSHDTHITEDYTSASYLLATSALFRGQSVFTNVHGRSEQGERAIVDILKMLGLEMTFDAGAHRLVVSNPRGRPCGDFEVDASDFPNIVPTLAALGSYVDGTFTVTGGRVTRFHKSSRIEAMAAELRSAGVDIKPLYADGVCDGFQVRGRASYRPSRTFTNWGDHRIFMSLFVASLRMKGGASFRGFEDVYLSFPDFFEQFGKAGVQTEIVPSGTATADPPLALAS